MREGKDKALEWSEDLTGEGFLPKCVVNSGK